MPELISQDHVTESRRGRWRATLGGSPPLTSEATPLTVELGCNGGHVLLEWAARDPSQLFLGLDWKHKQVVFGAEKAQARGLKNIHFLRSHLERLRYVFAPGEVDRFAIYFPDPWEKVAEWKNRFFTPSSLELLARLTRQGTGTLHLKTDHSEYFDWTLASLEELTRRTGELWRIDSISRDLHLGNPEAFKKMPPEVTIFEKVWLKQGIPIHELRLTRTSLAAPVGSPAADLSHPLGRDPWVIERVREARTSRKTPGP